MIKKTLYLVLTLAALTATSASIARAQSSEELAAPPSVTGLFKVQSADLLERRVQRLELLERLRAAGEAREKQAQRLEGSWVVTVAAVIPPGAPPPPVRTSYISFARGGVAILSERQAAFVNPAYGAWEHLGSSEFAFTVITDAFNAVGSFVGTVEIRNKITLTGQDGFVSIGQLVVRNPAGNVLFSGCATGRGERIRVEPLGEQCQGIEPPQ